MPTAQAHPHTELQLLLPLAQPTHAVPVSGRCQSAVRAASGAASCKTFVRALQTAPLRVFGGVQPCCPQQARYITKVPGNAVIVVAVGVEKSSSCLELALLHKTLNAQQHKANGQTLWQSTTRHDSDSSDGVKRQERCWCQAEGPEPELLLVLALSVSQAESPAHALNCCWLVSRHPLLKRLLGERIVHQACLAGQRSTSTALFSVTQQMSDAVCEICCCCSPLLFPSAVPLILALLTSRVMAVMVSATPPMKAPSSATIATSMGSALLTIASRLAAVWGTALWLVDRQQH